MIRPSAPQARLGLALAISLAAHALLLASFMQPRQRPGVAHAQATLNAALVPQPASTPAPEPEIAPPKVDAAPASAPVQPKHEVQAAPPAPRVGEGGLDSLPIPVVDIEPEYPESAYAQKLSGKVEVEVFIDETGRVEDARVVTATIADIFNQSALKAVRETRFTPGIAGGVPVKSVIHAVIVYDYKQ